VRLWGFHDKAPHIPTDVELAAVRPLVDYRGVLLDAEHRTAHFARPGVELDLGGIAKGFAVEIAGAVLRRKGLSGFIDAGGNQYLLGTPPGKPPWTIGIKDPDARDRVLGVVETGEISVSTSSDSYNLPRRQRPAVRPHPRSAHASPIDRIAQCNRALSRWDARRRDVEGGVHPRPQGRPGARRFASRHVGGHRVQKERRIGRRRCVARARPIVSTDPH
jgi:hypothetical protein